jgi:hypothetical protein
MIAHGPDRTTAFRADAHFGGISRVMEQLAAQQDDQFAFEVSQLLALISYSHDQDEPLDRDDAVAACQRVAYAWLLKQLAGALGRS